MSVPAHQTVHHAASEGPGSRPTARSAAPMSPSAPCGRRLLLASLRATRRRPAPAPRSLARLPGQRARQERRRWPTERKSRRRRGACAAPGDMRRHRPPGVLGPRPSESTVPARYRLPA
jgi:hypothetical protein